MNEELGNIIRREHYQPSKPQRYAAGGSPVLACDVLRDIRIRRGLDIETEEEKGKERKTSAADRWWSAAVALGMKRDMPFDVSAYESGRKPIDPRLFPVIDLAMGGLESSEYAHLVILTGAPAMEWASKRSDETQQRIAAGIESLLDTKVLDISHAGWLAVFNRYHPVVNRILDQEWEKTSRLKPEITKKIMETARHFKSEMDKIEATRSGRENRKQEKLPPEEMQCKKQLRSFFTRQGEKPPKLNKVAHMANLDEEIVSLLMGNGNTPATERALSKETKEALIKSLERDWGKSAGDIDKFSAVFDNLKKLRNQRRAHDAMNMTSLEQGAKLVAGSRTMAKGLDALDSEDQSAELQ